MPTIPEIEANLLLASSTGNATLFSSTLASITATQKPLITVYPQTLFNLTQLTTATLAESMTRNMMSTVGTYVDAFSIGDAMVDYSQEGNFGALDAVTDYLTAQQKTDLGFSPAPGQTLQNIAFFDQPFTTSDDTVIANAVRNLMQKLGAQTDAFSIGDVMVNFSQNGNWGALDAATDYLTAQQKTDLGFSPAPGQTLQNIAFHDQPFTTADDATIASVVRDLMVKLGAQVDAFSIGDAMVNFSQNGNWGALDAVTDYLSAQQKTDLGFSPAPGQTLQNIAFFDQPFTTSDDTVIANAVRNLMQKLGAQTDAFSIGDVMVNFSQNGNWGALDAATDYLTAQQKTDLGFSPAPGQTLQNIAFFDQPFTTADDAVIAKVTDNLMVKLGAQTDAFSIGDAMVNFSQNGNWGALDAVTDYLTAQQKTDLGFSPAPGQTLQNIAFFDQPFTTADDIMIAGEARDLVSKLGAQIDNFALTDATNIFSSNLNAAGVDAVIGELSSTQLTAILPGISAGLTSAGITLGTQSANTYNGTSAANKYIGLGGNDTINGNDGDDQLYGDLGNDIIHGNNHNDIIHGGSGNDTLYGDAGNDILLSGRGTDTMTGGTGADKFIFDGADVGSGTKHITDFNVGQGDKIDISDVLDQYDSATDALSSFAKLTVSGVNTLLQVDVNGTESGGFSTLVILDNVTGLDLNTLVNNGTIIV